MDFVGEAEERKNIQTVYPNLDNITDWQVLLSNWKIVNHLYEEIPNFHTHHLNNPAHCGMQ
jgi:hypothetical protein